MEKCFKNLDLFGKEARLYYEKEDKKSTNYGICFSILYILIYATIFIYKLYRMIKRKDVLFYETFAYIEEPPSIKLTQDNFYGGFGLEDPKTYDPFIDETIYIPKAYFKKAERHGDLWSWDVKEIELEKCKIEKFGEFFKEKFNSNSLNNLYCFKEMNETFIGHFSYDIYSFFYIQLFPCINSTENNNHCKPLEVIDYYLKGTFLCMEFEDVELTPENYTYPVRPRNQDIYFTVGKKLFKEIHVYYQIVNIETDIEKFGIDEWKKYKEEQHLKYNSIYQMTNILENDIYETGEAFCDITIKLHDEIRITYRSYKKIMEIWGDVGGLMEVIFIIFKFISSFPINILYDLDVVNKLFEFNHKDGLIFVKKIQKHIKKEKLYFDFQIMTKMDNNKKNNNFILNEGFLNNCHLNKNNKNILNNDNLNNDSISTYNSDNSKKTEKDSIKNKEEKIIKKVEFSRFNIYFCFFCIRKRKNGKNFLMNQGMKLFIEKMNIFSIFKKSMNNDELLLEIQTIEMPDYKKKNYYTKNRSQNLI